MAANITEIRGKVTPRIKDTKGRLSTTPDVTCDVDRAIAAAVAEYSRDRPRTVVVQVTGSGAFDYLVSAFGAAASGATPSTQWVVDFSQLTRVVYPYSASNQSDEALDEAAYTVIVLPGGTTLRFLEDRPSAAEVFLLWYTRPHDLTAALSSIPATDDEALADLAAANCCDMLEAAYTQQAETSVQADLTNRSERTEDYHRLAGDYRAKYNAHVGKGGSSGGSGATVPAAGAFADIDRGFSDAARSDYFFHGRRRT